MHTTRAIAHQLGAVRHLQGYPLLGYEVSYHGQNGGINLQHTIIGRQCYPPWSSLSSSPLSRPSIALPRYFYSRDRELPPSSPARFVFAIASQRGEDLSNVIHYLTVICSSNNYLIGTNTKLAGLDYGGLSAQCRPTLSADEIALLLLGWNPLDAF